MILAADTTSSTTTSEPKSWLDRYAHAVVAQGVGLRSGQDLYIRGQEVFRDFAIRLGEAAYDLGARRVIYRMGDPAALDQLLRRGRDEHIHLHHLDDRAWYHEVIRGHGALIALVAAHPDRSVFPAEQKKRLATFSAELGTTTFQVLRHSVDDGLFPFCCTPGPSVSWACHLFPDLPQDDALTLLAETLLGCCHDGDSTALSRHAARLRRLTAGLDALAPCSLSIRGGGSDLALALHPSARWCCALKRTGNGQDFWVNFPSEEVYTCPDALSAEGRLRTTRPLVLPDGIVIDRLELTFEQGEVIHFETSNDSSAFRRWLELDPGARRLGEIALVSHENPIARAREAFAHQLLDENTGCHAALGQSYPTTLTQPAPDARRANQSNLHLDLVFGSPELEVEATLADGSTRTLLQAGEWHGMFGAAGESRQFE